MTKGGSGLEDLVGYVLGVCLALLAILVRPFLKVFFCYFDVKQIGHIAGIYYYWGQISERQKLAPGRCVVLFEADSPVANSAFLALMTRPFSIKASVRGVHRARNFFLKLGLSRFVILPEAHISFRPETYWELEPPSGFLRNQSFQGLPKPENLSCDLTQKDFICLHVRDGAYKRQHFGTHIPYGGGLRVEEEDHRNSPSDTLTPLLTMLDRRNMLAVNMGKVSVTRFPSSLTNLVSYAGSTMWSETADLWLASNCRLWVSLSPSGLQELPAAFGKTTLICNVFPYYAMNLARASFIYLPRPVFDLESGAEMSLLQVMSRAGFHGLSTTTSLMQFQLRLGANHPKDIVAAFDEAESSSLGTLNLGKDEKKRQERIFQALFGHSAALTNLQGLISPAYLDRNPNWSAGI